MADYYSILKKTIASLPESNGASRRSVYSRARNAIVNQLKAYEPPLSPSEITSEQLRLEEAIRKIEAEAARAELGLTEPNTIEEQVPLDDNIESQADFEASDEIELEISGQSTSSEVEGRYLVRETKEAKEKSILKSSITDFDFDNEREIIAPVNFKEDKSTYEDKELEHEKNNLINSLAETANRISENLETRNNNENRLKTQLEYYKKYASQETPNPRLLRRCGDTIAQRVMDEDTRGSLNDWDLVEVEGFIEDHKELMRLYFRGTLARAQEVEAAGIDPQFAEIAPQIFDETADMLAQIRKNDGSELVDEEIRALLRDISDDIKQDLEACEFTTDEHRKSALLKTALENAKNGSLIIGQFLFFTTLFVLAPPQVLSILGALGSLASIAGLMKQNENNNIKKKYEQISEYFPDLPKLPEK